MLVNKGTAGFFWAWLAVLLFATTGSAGDLLLFGDTDHGKFLGCLSCCSQDLNSVWNEWGFFGSEHNLNSIWNPHGTYESKFDSRSPWNSFSVDAPVIVDNDGNFYGYFSTNKFHSKRTQIEFFVWVLDNYEVVNERFGEVAGTVKCN